MIRTINNTYELYNYSGIISIKEQLKFLAASKLRLFTMHYAAKGSRYIMIDDVFLIRMSNHSNLSKDYEEPDINAVNRKLTQDDYRIAEERIGFPEFVTQSRFSKYVGLSIPKLKSILPDNCYDEIVPNLYYCNTKRKFILTEAALNFLDGIGHTERHIYRCEEITYEDYNGGY